MMGVARPWLVIPAMIVVEVAWVVVLPWSWHRTVRHRPVRP
jgi:hypothetical protein